MEQKRGAVQHVINKVYCNCCGREIVVEGKGKEDYLEVSKAWGYFSNKNLTGQAFNLCEQCYDEFTAKFKVPVEEFECNDMSMYNDMPMYTEEELEALNEAYAKELSK